MEIIGYCAAIMIGISLGMIGGGGSILTVPVFVYLMHMNPILATTSSLFVVGITSLSGGIRGVIKKEIDYRAVTQFGLPSVISVFLTRHYLLPAIPHHLFTVGNLEISREVFLMLTFGLLMIGTSFSLIANRPMELSAIKKQRRNRIAYLIAMGLMVGVVTGLLGAGGGFLIIPFLVLVLDLTMKIAVRTSLLIIAINSLFGFFVSLHQFEFDWRFLVVFSLLSIGGIMIGSRMADKIPSAVLKKGFGYFVLLMGICIIIVELFL